MNNAATWMVGITHMDKDDEPTAYVALGINGCGSLNLPPKAARQVARSLLLSAEDAEQFNAPSNSKPETDWPEQKGPMP